MQTDRDARIVAWLGRIGAAGGVHVSQRFGMSLCRSYQRLGFLVADGLVEHRAVLHRRAGLYSATSKGLSWQGLGRLSAYKVQPGTFEHAWQVASAATALHVHLPSGWQIVGEREIKVLEADSEGLFASARISRPGSQLHRHRPDLALVSPSGCVVPVEIELSVKSPARLQRICAAWVAARHIDHVYYLAEHSAGRAVHRAASRLKAEDRVTVLALNDVAGLVERQLGREAQHTSREAEDVLGA